MNVFCQFYIENGVLSVRLECYTNVSKHYTVFQINREKTAELMQIVSVASETDLLKYLTAKYSTNNEFIPFLAERNIEYTIVDKGYEDTSCDI